MELLPGGACVSPKNQILFSLRELVQNAAIIQRRSPMKKRKKINTDESRRRFMAYFSGTALGSTLVPGILWGRMQDANAQSITLAMLTDALKVGGVEFTEE